MQEKKTSTSSWLSKFLRSGLFRIVAGFSIIIVVEAIVQILFGLLPFGNLAVALLSALATALAAALCYYGIVHLTEKRPVTELTVSWGALGELAAGILLGGLLFSVTVGILWAFGYYRVSGVNPWSAALPMLALSIISGVVEELLFRGVLFRIMEESLGTWLSLAISALFFGLAHLMNPNASLTAAIAIALEAGIMLCAAYLLTRRLWLAIGIHFAWNFTQGGVFGIAVSGYQQPGLLISTLNGPQILSGGEFGAEASLFAIIVCLVAGAFLTWCALRKGNFVRPFWKREKA